MSRKTARRMEGIPHLAEPQTACWNIVQVAKIESAFDIALEVAGLTPRTPAEIAVLFAIRRRGRTAFRARRRRLATRRARGARRRRARALLAIARITTHF